MSTSAPSLAAMLLYVYDGLTAGKHYTLSGDGASIATWKPPQSNLAQPTVAQVTTAYHAMQAQDAAGAKIEAAMAALTAFWKALSPYQQSTLLTFQSAISTGLVSSTAATIKALNAQAATLTHLSPKQAALKTAAMAAVNAIL